MRCVGRLQILLGCCFVTTVMSAITLTAWTHLYRRFPREAGSANGLSLLLYLCIYLFTYVCQLGSQRENVVIGPLIYHPIRCVCCMQCGASSPGFHCEWQNNYNHCGPCASLVTCPVCHENFMEEELLLQCQHCDRSVTAIFY